MAITSSFLFRPVPAEEEEDDDGEFQEDFGSSDSRFRPSIIAGPRQRSPSDSVTTLTEQNNGSTDEDLILSAGTDNLESSFASASARGATTRRRRRRRYFPLVFN